MEFNGKFLSIERKKKGSVVKFTSNILVNYGQFEDTVNKDYSITADNQVSDKFGTIIRSFIGHALIRLGLNSAALEDEKVMKSRKCVSMPEYKNFDVTKIEFKGDDENEQIHIKLSWKTPEDEIVAIQVPGINTLSGDYNFQKYLADDIANLRQEVIEYVKDNNYKPSQQLDLFKKPVVAESDDEM